MLPAPAAFIWRKNCSTSYGVSVAIRRVPIEERTWRCQTPSYPRTVLGLGSCRPLRLYRPMASITVVSPPHLDTRPAGGCSAASVVLRSAISRASARSAARVPSVEGGAAVRYLAVGAAPDEDAQFRHTRLPRPYAGSTRSDVGSVP